MRLSSRELLFTSTHAPSRLSPAGAQDAAAKSRKTAEKVENLKSMVGCVSVRLCPLWARPCRWWFCESELLLNCSERASTSDRWLSAGFFWASLRWVHAEYRFKSHATRRQEDWVDGCEFCGQNDYIVLGSCSWKDNIQRETINSLWGMMDISLNVPLFKCLMLFLFFNQSTVCCYII